MPSAPVKESSPSPRAAWIGAITFGLVNLPVRLYPAIRRRDVRFHELCDADSAPIRHDRRCSKTGELVPWGHVVKGFEVERGRYVAVSREELAAVIPVKARTVAIDAFTSLAEIDLLLHEHTWYAAPERGAERAYALLAAALEARGKVGIGRGMIRGRQRLCAVRALGRTLAVSTLTWADEVLPAASVGPPTEQPDARELQLAEQLVDARTTRFVPEAYRDEHRERVLAYLERKARGEAPVVMEEEPAPASHARSLTVTLEESLAAVRSGEKAA